MVMQATTLCSICHAVLPTPKHALIHFRFSQSCKEAGGEPVVSQMVPPQPDHEMGVVRRSLLSGLNHQNNSHIILHLNKNY